MVDSPPRHALLIMAKRPQAGHTKTRLTPGLTPNEAAALYACFLADIASNVANVQLEGAQLVPFFAFAPASEAAYFNAIDPTFDHVIQQGANLSARLDGVLAATLAAGFTSVVAMSSDSPTLPQHFLNEAFTRLNQPSTDVVFGPCDDGGYYLIGIKKHHPTIVANVEMSTPTVLDDSLALAAEANLRVSLLPNWNDVDEPADLQQLWEQTQADPARAPQTHQFLSSIIPHRVLS